MAHRDENPIFEVEQGSTRIVCPVLEFGHRTRTLAFNWAQVWAASSGMSVTVYRNGARMIEIPAPNAHQ